MYKLPLVAVYSLTCPPHIGVEFGFNHVLNLDFNFVKLKEGNLMRKLALISICMFSAFAMFGCLNDESISGSNKVEPQTLSKTGCTFDEKDIPTKLAPGFTFQVGVPVYSPDKSVKLVFQSDGNLVLYFGTEWVSQTHTYDHIPKPNRAVYQSDGNLVLYNGTRPVWNSQTYRYPNSSLNIYNSTSSMGEKLKITIPYTQPDSTNCPVRIWETISIKFPGYTFPNW